MSEEGDFAWARVASSPSVDDVSGRQVAGRPLAPSGAQSNEQARLVWALGERVKELAALHEVARLLNRPQLSVPEMLQGVVNLMPPAFQYPEQTHACIRYRELSVTTPEFPSASPCRLVVEHHLSDGSELELVVLYSAMEHVAPSQAFLTEELELVRSVIELISGALERQTAQERVDLALTGIDAGIWDWDFDSGRVSWSTQMERMAGLEPGTFGGTLAAFRALVHPEDGERVSLAGQAAIKDPNQKFSVEFRMQRDGAVRWVSSTGRVFRDRAGRPYRVLGLAIDCTARHALEDRLLQAQRMEAIGGLAAGIAHDFNNVLSVIMSYAELALFDLAPQNPLRADVHEIKTAAQRAGELTRHLLAFSRQQVLTPRVFELNQVLTELQKMLSRLISEDIKLSISLGAQLGRVHADPGQIEQVVVNLVVNARDAMPGGGSLSVETRNVELDESYARGQEDLKPGSYVMLAVSDSGVGMTAELKARIFEPFFTTKPQGKGTGLGLATAFGIVRQSGGHIAVYSEPGQGSVFKVYLPRVDRPVDAVQPPVRAAKVLRGDETILLVEDEAQVRAVAGRILREHGYEVLEAQNGGEALLLCEQHGHRLGLLLTDVVMPLIGGRQLAGRLGAAWPKLKVLYMSGYTDDAVIRHGVLDAGAAFVQKPLTPQELLSKVRALLDQP